jgi:Zn-dependent alcohol dehydrogenase
MTGPAQTAIADIGTLNIMVTVRTIGATGVIQGTAWWDHRGTAANTTTSGTGFANDTTGHVETTSGAIDVTAYAGKYVGLSINGGTSASWTVTQVWADASW